jgi:hypothetical protein
MIELDDYESQLVYLSKGWFEYDDIFDALIKLREKYYLVHELQENRVSYIHTLSDIAYFGIYCLMFEKLYEFIFAKEYHRREFFNEIIGNKLWFTPDWKDGQLVTLLDYQEFTIKNIINRLMSLLSTLQIKDYEFPMDFKYPSADRGKIIEIIHLQPIDYTVLPRKKRITDERQKEILGY